MCFGQLNPLRGFASITYLEYITSLGLVRTELLARGLSDYLGSLNLGYQTWVKAELWFHILSGQSVSSLLLSKSEIVNLPGGLLVVVWAFIYTEGLLAEIPEFWSEENLLLDFPPWTHAGLCSL